METPEQNGTHPNSQVILENGTDKKKADHANDDCKVDVRNGGDGNGAKQKEAESGAEAETEAEEEDCCMDNLDNCCGDNVRGVRDCACCLKQCSCEIWHGCRHINCKDWLREAFTWENFKNKFPVLKWLPKYRLDHFLGDLIAGLTVGLTIVPQALAYSKIANLSSQYGIYTAFTCCYVYIIFGTCKDANLGPAAVLSLLVSQYANGNAAYAVALSLVCGLVQFVLGLFHLGFIVNYVSHPVLESFTTTAVVTIIVGQIKNWLGLKDIPGDFLKQVYWTCKKIPETQIWDFVLGLVCMIVLILLKRLKTTSCIKKKSTSIPVRILKYIAWLCSTARNAVVVICATGAAAIFVMYDMDPFSLTGDIPQGLPPFKPPAFSMNDGNNTFSASDLFQSINAGFVLVPLISFIETIAVAKNFASKGNYRVDKDQELIASGVANVLGSFLSAYPVTATFSGSAVNCQSGVKTTMGNFYTATLVMLVLLFLTPLFYYIPIATLAAVIMMAVVDIADFVLVIELWRVKKIDLIPWFATFIFGLIFGIQNGLIIGIILALCILIFPASRPKVKMGPYGSRYSLSLTNSPDYVVLVIDQGLMYPSVDHFTDHVMNSVLEGGSCIYKSVVLDLSHIPAVDYTIVQGLGQLVSDFSVMKVSIVLCNVRPAVAKVFTKAHLKLPIAKNIEEAVAMIKKTSDGDELALAEAFTVLSSKAFDVDVNDSTNSDPDNNNDTVHPSNGYVGKESLGPAIDDDNDELAKTGGIYNESFQF